jgi:hypothetical protein
MEAENNPLLTKNQMYIGGVLVLIVLIFVLGNYFGKTSKTNKQIDVQVDIKDENGNTIDYDPNELLERLNKGLTTTYFFDFSERCDPIQELYELDSVRFMAVVRAYKVKYGVDIQVHIAACNVGCDGSGGYGGYGYFMLIEKRIAGLESIIK